MIRRFLLSMSVVLAGLCAPAALAVDPPYEADMERLVEVLGSLYFLQPLCGINGEDWRAQASDVISLDNPAPDRRERLAGAFNAGYQNYARVYKSCTPPAEVALKNLLVEAEQKAREIHTRFSE